MARILLVEDNITNQILVKETLAHHQLVIADTLEAATEYLKTAVDLVLLDVHLPDGNGFDFFLKIQKHLPDTPVIFLTSKSETADKVVGYTLGADDYITKPFEPLEFRVRVDARLKKLNKDSSQRLHRIENMVLNLDLQKVTVESPNGPCELELTSFEFKLLLYLAKNKNILLTRDQLMENVWGGNLNVQDRAIDTHMSKLRKKLDGTYWTIKSVYGSGYRLTQKAD